MREEILAMEPGRELDIQVYKNVIYRDTPNWILNDDLKERDFTLPSYSTDISASMELLEKMKSDGWSVSITTWGNDKHERPEWKDKWKVVFGFEGGPYCYESYIITESICKAALLAVMEVGE